MAVAVFGLVHGDVKAHYFPALADFGSATKPTSTAVGEMITDAAAVLGARLTRLGLAVAALSTDAGATYPIAYAWCRKYVRLRAGIAAYRAMAGGGETPKEMADELLMLEAELEDSGLTALGDASIPSQDAQGPRSHISNHSLDTGDEDDISDAIPRYRMNDEL